MKIIDLGLISFKDAEAVQERRVQEVADGAENTLYLLEHTPVVTLGRQGGLESLKASPEYLAAQGIDLVQTRRGGNITCHYPGQLVAYPVFRLERGMGGVRGFFRAMEEVAILMLAGFGILGERCEGHAGVWVGAKKIASTGIAVRRWVTYHGLSLNVGLDLSLFSFMNPCGMDIMPTSVHQELGANVLDMPDMAEMKNACAREFQEVFTHPQVAARKAS
ncbi:MAG: lipoyl(octanoyl) transferase LipB [Thermodesulfobacteriota bacterium]|nr:lipoyl(octanoyl) transferase LipB [Thermodesulfobacteriota bacterium]